MSPEKQDFFRPIVNQTEKTRKDVAILSRQRGGSNRLIDSAVLTVAAATVTFATIPNIYGHLLILYYARGTTAAAVARLSMRFNADAGANYDYILAQWRHNAILFTEEGLGSASIARISSIPAATAPADTFSTGTIRINSYANTTRRKTVIGINNPVIGTTTGNIREEMGSGVWKIVPEAAIATILLFPDAGNFEADTRFDLYGIQGGP